MQPHTHTILFTWRATGGLGASQAAGEALHGSAVPAAPKPPDRPSRKRSADVPAALGRAGKTQLKHMARWKELRQQAVEEEAARTDAGAAEAARARQAEEWRLAQLHSGAADANPNFAVRKGPVRVHSGLAPGSMVDCAFDRCSSICSPCNPVQPLRSGRWMPDGEQAGTATKSQATEHHSQSMASTTSARLPVVESSEVKASLPPGWQAILDPASGQLYYANLETQVRAWGDWICWARNDVPPAAAGVQ